MHLHRYLHLRVCMHSYFAFASTSLLTYVYDADEGILLCIHRITIVMLMRGSLLCIHRDADEEDLYFVCTV
jgi:hypothetical protein